MQNSNKNKPITDRSKKMLVLMADGSEGDTADSKRSIPSKPVDPAHSQGTIDSNEYSMNHERRGLCIIFNHEKFDFDERHGTKVDAACLEDCFKALDFDVQTHTDLPVREVMRVLDKARKADHSKYSCFVCCLLTHGDNNILYARDGKYFTDQIFAKFRRDVCPKLDKKPKMFFIQACQGCKTDSGVKVVCKESLECATPLKIYTHPDFLIAYSTFPGYLAYRNKDNGSYFIQALCKALEDHARDKDILQILTIVNRKVAFNFESDIRKKKLRFKKQMPVITSTLIKDLKFYP